VSQMCDAWLIEVKMYNDSNTVEACYNVVNQSVKFNTVQVNFAYKGLIKFILQECIIIVFKMY